MLPEIEEYIFLPEIDFAEKAIRIFQFQYANNPVYKRFVNAINCKITSVKTIDQIPFLPISIFKNTSITSTVFRPEIVFESSGTTGMQNSRHLVKDVLLYEKSFTKGFEMVYGPIKNYCVLGLLPSYLERSGSSLVYMVKRMIEISGHPLSGFYLYNHANLAQKLKQLEKSGQPTLLIGVTYALLDFAQSHPMPLQNTIIMETGGMKGRKQEMLRLEVHEILQKAFNLKSVHSEYGMTELLSQAYSQSSGLFNAPPWMKILIREEDDPFALHAQTNTSITGALNIIDLANVYSCSFIATDDLGRMHADGSFEVLGRMDNSDVRGCSLMVS